MANSNNQSSKKWWGVVILILFGALVAWDFSAISNVAIAIVIGVIIGAVVVVLSKTIGVELGWPKN